MENQNYTNPEQAGEGQNQQDLINASLIFARASRGFCNKSEGVKPNFSIAV